MRKRTELAIWTAVVATSLGLHAVAFGGLGQRDDRSDGFGRKKPRPPTLVEMSVAKPKEVPPPPEPPKPVVKERVALARPARAKSAPPPSAPPTAAPPPAAETAADFTGVTMTNDGAGEGWASATGNGQAMNGPVGRPGARVTRRNVDGDSAARPHGDGTPVVGVGDLSRPPVAPDLGAMLERNYPADARAKGQAGKAVVKARVMPDGRVREFAVVSESLPGFGAACVQTLRGSTWSPPIDRSGRAVSTYINYTCRFNVQ